MVISLGASIWAVRKARGVIRKHILRWMPVDQRISEDGFRIQNRYNIIVSGIAVLLLTSLLTWSWTRLVPATKSEKAPKVRKVEKTVEFKPIPTSPKPKPGTVKQKDTLESKPPAVPAASTVDPVPQTKPASTPLTQPTPAIPTTGIYVQRHSVGKLSNALLSARALAREFNLPTHIAVLPNEPDLYKVVLGPFSDSTSAERFIRQKLPEGWVRSIARIHLVD